jgi:hypothetical protein
VRCSAHARISDNSKVASTIPSIAVKRSDSSTKLAKEVLAGSTLILGQRKKNVSLKPVHAWIVVDVNNCFKQVFVDISQE